MIPVFGDDWKVWARQLTTALKAMPLQLRFRTADSKATEDGVLMWDAATSDVVVSDGGEWVPLNKHLTLTLGPFFINDLPGTATTQATLGYFDTATTVLRNGNSVRMAVAGRVVGIAVVSDASRTAGTATARARITGTGTDFDGGSVQLNGTELTSDSAFVRYEDGVAFSAGAFIGCEIVTSGWTPTTANITAWVVVALDTLP